MTSEDSVEKDPQQECPFCDGTNTERRIESREKVDHELWFCDDCTRRFIVEEGGEAHAPGERR